MNNEIEFFNACRENDLIAVNKILDSVDIDFANNSGSTLLMLASMVGAVTIVELLCNKGAKLNLIDNDGWTALIRASRFDYPDVVNVLCKSGADINMASDRGMSALMLAALNGHIDVVKTLCKNGAIYDLENDRGETAYQIANENDKIQVMYFFNKDIAHQQDESGSTILIKYCEDLNGENILFLHEKGADFYLENIIGESPLSILMAYDDLQGELQALKEKLVLEKIISETEDYPLSL